VYLQNKNIKFGGQGWIIDPEGNVLDVTSDQKPFITREINLTFAEQSKKNVSEVCTGLMQVI